MSKIFVFLEGGSAGLKKGSLELLTAAKQSGREVVAALIGSRAKELSAQAAKFGAKTVFICEGEETKTYNPETYSSVITGMIK